MKHRCRSSPPGNHSSARLLLRAVQAEHNQTMNKYRFSGVATRRGAAHGGFTLVELIVTLAIMAILATLAAPPLRTLLVKRTVSNQADALGAALRLARSEAIKRGQPVTICASPAPEAAQPQCAKSGATNWATGWLVFVDHDNNRGQFDSGETLLKVQAPFRASGALNNNATSNITYRANGMMLPLTMSTFTVMPDSKDSPAAMADIIRCVAIGTGGRVRISKPDSKGECS